MKNFLDLALAGPDLVAELVALAGRLQRRPEPDALRGKVLGLLFMNPSLRTLASFQSGMARLGGSSLRGRRVDPTEFKLRGWPVFPRR